MANELVEALRTKSKIDYMKNPMQDEYLAIVGVKQACDFLEESLRMIDCSDEKSIWGVRAVIEMMARQLETSLSWLDGLQSGLCKFSEEQAKSEVQP